MAKPLVEGDEMDLLTRKGNVISLWFDLKRFVPLMSYFSEWRGVWYSGRGFGETVNATATNKIVT